MNFFFYSVKYLKILNRNNFTFTVDDHGSSQRYASFSTDDYGSIFGVSLDLKSDSVNSRQHHQPHIDYGISNPDIPPNGLHSILSAAVQSSTPSSTIGSSLPVSLNMRSCMNSTIAPTIYTIEDQSGDRPLINLAPPSIVTDGNSGGENDITPSSRPAQQKKRKLSVTECFPMAGNAISATTTSTRVKQEPRNTNILLFAFLLSFSFKTNVHHFCYRAYY